MRKRKTVKIDDREFTVKELTPQDLIELVEDDAGLDLEFFRKNLSRVTDATLDDLRKMAFSEINELLDAFKEVNAVFFAWAERAGVASLFGELKASIAGDLNRLFAGLSRRGMQGPQDTDTLSS
jgi:hypothetical protein